MKITLKTLNLSHFKGCEKLTVNFSDNTTISGKNEVGKTTFSVQTGKESE